MEKEIFYLFAAKNKYLDSLNKHKIASYLSKAYEYSLSNDNSLLNSVRENKEILPEVEKKLTAQFEKFNELYLEEYK